MNKTHGPGELSRFMETVTNHASMQPLELRLVCSSSTVQVIGSVIDTFRQQGLVAHTGVTDRVVYDDLNDNGKLDAGEPSASTGLDGTYKIRLPRGEQQMRLVELPGWEANETGTDAAALLVTGTNIAGPTFSTKMIKPVRVDVLATYTVASLDGRDKHAMATFVRSLFIDANQVFANSDTNVVLNPVAIEKTAYHESGSIDDDLDNLGDASATLAAVEKLRDEDKADLSVMFTSGARTKGDDVGVAYEYDPSDSEGSENGFSVVALQDDGTDGITLAHEFGHNFGAGHDAPDNDGPGVTAYAYGYHFIGDDGELYQDVMDYSDGTILPFFSTPDFSWEGKPIGNSKHADNALIVRQEATAVADYR